jgi:hypothetical protein
VLLDIIPFNAFIIIYSGFLYLEKNLKPNQMKYIAYFLVVSLFVACAGSSNEQGSSSETATQDNQEQPSTGSNAAQSGPEYTSHYVCPDHCSGSGGNEQGKCPVCGKDYIHNDAFHKQTDNQQQPPSATPDLNTSPVINTPPQQQVDIEALKKKGPEYLAHYTCPSYCKGSGGSEQGKCPVCGKDYVHNDAFHQLNGM